MHRIKCHPRLLAALLLLGLALTALGCGFTQTMSDYWHDLMDSQDTNLRKRVVVAPFLSKLPGMEARAKALGLAISQRLEKQGGMVMVEFKELRQALTQVSPRIENSEDRIVAAARSLGLNTVLSGAVVNLSMQYDKTGIYGFRENEPFALMELDLKLIDVATGVLLAETTLSIRTELTETQASNIRLGQPYPPKVVDKLQGELVSPAMRWISQNISAQAWVGFILAVEGERIKVTVGRDTGLSLGSQLTVYAKGEAIKSGSGRILYMPGPVVGRIKLVKFEPRTAWAVPVWLAADDAAKAEAEKQKELEAQREAERKQKEQEAKEAKAAVAEAGAKPDTGNMAFKAATPPEPKVRTVTRRLTFEPGQILRTR
ncbi:MAG: hypothetical protein KQI62_04720 [Deltaproteobacteria bacterium]|nr:hypothetical protein [Deltaproteobacteria bacterium]